MAVEDLGSNPIMRLSIGRKKAPPPRPPTLPKAPPINPTAVPATMRHPNSISWYAGKYNRILEIFFFILLISFFLPGFFWGKITYWPYELIIGTVRSPEKGLRGGEETFEISPIIGGTSPCFVRRWHFRHLQASFCRNYSQS